MWPVFLKPHPIACCLISDCVVTPFLAFCFIALNLCILNLCIQSSYTVQCCVAKADKRYIGDVRYKGDAQRHVESLMMYWAFIWRLFCIWKWLVRSFGLLCCNPRGLQVTSLLPVQRALQVLTINEEKVCCGKGFTRQKGILKVKCKTAHILPLCWMSAIPKKCVFSTMVLPRLRKGFGSLRHSYLPNWTQLEKKCLNVQQYLCKSSRTIFKT